MLHIHFLQQWFGLSDPAMEEALHDTPLYCEFARLDAGLIRMPDETTILRFRHLLEEHNLSIQLLATINATLIAKGILQKQAMAERFTQRWMQALCVQIAKAVCGSSLSIEPSRQGS